MSWVGRKSVPPTGTVSLHWITRVGCIRVVPKCPLRGGLGKRTQSPIIDVNTKKSLSNNLNFLSRKFQVFLLIMFTFSLKMVT